MAVWVAPEEGAGLEGGVGPAGVGFEAVMASTQWCEVAVAGLAASAVGDDVVVVARTGRAGAPGERAVVVAQGDPGLEAVGDLVRAGVVVVVEVDDGEDLDCGLRSAAPVLDLLGQDGPVGGVVAADGVTAA